MTASKIRVVVAKPGLDGHDRGAKIIARALRDAGMEVIYTGLHQTPEQIVETVLQEDADAVGLSILSGAHMTLVPKAIELLREQDAGDVVVCVGGTIPAQDIPELKELGVAEVFTPGAPTQGQPSSMDSAVETKLGTVKRPDGTTQVTFNGMPLYTFVEDSSGQVTGDGFADSFGGVNFVWTAATVGGGGTNSAPSTTTQGSSGGSSGGY